MEYTNTTMSTTIFRTLVVHPSATHPPAPSATPSMPSKSSTAIEDLNKLPGGLWALIILVAAVLVGGIVWFAYTKATKKKEEEEGEEPKKTEGIPNSFGGILEGLYAHLADISWHSLDTLAAAALTPQTALSSRWLRGDVDHVQDRPLPVIIEATGPNVTPPDPASLTGDKVKFIPVPPGYRLLPPPPAPTAPPASVVVSAASPLPRPKKRDPPALSATTTTVRNVSHGFKKVLDEGSTAAVAPVA
ncbi:hypothetical protein N7537_003181 [Penicillium hordei]|uniref:Uncharacterized protein n=1 Tax=Penicillium hordei TaxID=40994 RepID=A0AAD6H9I8_9EURO|nr:uncharacterized protein N7537_003181 [Penicillium hordei]KAJ5618067.1 hypothetical protein N7537_003181 [Penicillium hordei]